MQEHEVLEEYEWTRKRLMLGALILLVGLGIPAYLAWPMAPNPTLTQLMLENRKQFDWSNAIIKPELVISGGPSLDAIPALRTTNTTRPPGCAPSRNEGANDAQIVSIADDSVFGPLDRVVGITLNNESRAYPIGILNFHEAVNDELGGVPICVIFCPLCDSITIVDRHIDGHVLEFGTSGLLYNSNVVLYDRKHFALWSQVKLQALTGPYAGRSLKHLNTWQISTLQQWRERRPESTMLSTNTGHDRSYTQHPYSIYTETKHLMFEVEREDDRMPRKTPVIGIRDGDVARAYAVHEITRRGGVIEDQINGQPVRLEADGFNRTVRVVTAPPKAQVAHTYWFAWYAIHPKTEVVGSAPTPSSALGL